MIDLVCLGELLFDMLPAETGRRLSEVNSFFAKPGGSPANVAVAAARLGMQSAFIGKVGDDAFGHHLAEILHLGRVDIRGLRFDPRYKTTLAFIALPDANQPEFLFYPSPGADVMLNKDDVDPDLLRSVRAFHFGSLSQAQEPCRSAALEGAQIAHRAGALISFDANYRLDYWHNTQEFRRKILAALPQVDLLKVNEAELELLTGRSDLGSARQLLEFGPRACVVTLGQNGSYFQTRSKNILVSAFRVTVVDTTGCGDGFVAGLLARILSFGNWEKFITSGELTAALRYANAVGALTAMKPGAIPAFPSDSEVEQFLYDHQG